MKRIIYFTFLLFLIPFTGWAQSPQAFNYQAAVRDGSGNVMANQNVAFQISILETNAAGNAVYVETHNASTNAHGLVTLAIGEGNLISGDFTNIDWGNDLHFIQVELDENGGTNFQLMGVSQLLTVPYAMHASTVENDMVDDADADPTNEMQDISLNGTDLSISAGSTVDLSVVQDGVDDADNDPANELQNISINGTILSISSGSTVDLSVVQDGVDDADNDPANELQDISLSGTNLSITSGSTVDLSAVQDGVDDADNNPSNELISSTTLVGNELRIVENGTMHTTDLSPLSGTSPWNVQADTISANNDFVHITNTTVGTALDVRGTVTPLKVTSDRGAGFNFTLNEYGETIWQYGPNEFARIDIGPGPAGFMELMSTGSTQVYINSSGTSYLNGGKVGIGTTNPTSKLEVDNGDIEVVDSLNGVILKSPNGTRYRITIDNAGNIVTTPI